MTDAPRPSLLPLIDEKRILVIVGSGGVGKTTTAAALGLLATRQGRRSLVMTIDPARRLATSLGLASLDHEPRPVPEEKLAEAGVPAGQLHAMMLDPKHTFDDLVRRHATDPQSAQQLLGSRIYQQLSAKLAGSQEYAAMEKLHAIHEAQSYGLVVLDTPPTANALDFLDAPQKMVDAVESPTVSLFVGAYRSTGRFSLGALGLGAAYVMRRLARFTGGEFLDQIAGFLFELSGLLGGMRDRAAQVMELLRRPEVGFVIVASPDPRSIDEAIGLHERLARSGMSPSALVVNKVHPLAPFALDETAVREALERGLVPPEESAATASRLAPLLLAGHEALQVLARADVVQLQRLAERCGPDCPHLRVPLFDEDIHDVRGLVRLADCLA